MGFRSPRLCPQAKRTPGARFRLDLRAASSHYERRRCEHAMAIRCSSTPVSIEVTLPSGRSAVSPFGLRAGRSPSSQTVPVRRARESLSSGGDALVENLDFTGARSPDRNGAGIRLDVGGRLTVKRCRFEGNENGILTSNDPSSEQHLTDSEFLNNGAGDGQSHNVYVGLIAQLTVTCASPRSTAEHRLRRQGDCQSGLSGPRLSGSLTIPAARFEQHAERSRFQRSNGRWHRQCLVDGAGLVEVLPFPPCQSNQARSTARRPLRLRGVFSYKTRKDANARLERRLNDERPITPKRSLRGHKATRLPKLGREARASESRPLRAIVFATPPGYRERAARRRATGACGGSQRRWLITISSWSDPARRIFLQPLSIDDTGKQYLIENKKEKYPGMAVATV